MAREIKFRAWLLIAKEMLYMGWNGSTFYTLSNLFALGDSAELMQYTGLKDANGVEIYESDIVLVRDSYTDIVTEGTGVTYDENHCAEVKFEQGSFGVLIREGAEYYSQGFYSFNEVEGTTGLDTLQVIGNIYENPELIK